MPSAIDCLKPKYGRVPWATGAHGRRPDRVFGVIVIAPWRNNIARLHRPWRAISENAIDATRRRFSDSSRQAPSADHAS